MKFADVINTLKSNLEQIEDKAMASGFGVVGVRVQEQPFTEGEALNNSFVWIDGDMTDEELNGTCALSLDYADQVNSYFGGHVAIIAGNSFEYGADLGEIVIKDAHVLEVYA